MNVVDLCVRHVRLSLAVRALALTFIAAAMVAALGCGSQSSTSLSAGGGNQETVANSPPSADETSTPSEPGNPLPGELQPAETEAAVDEPSEPAAETPAAEASATGEPAASETSATASEGDDKKPKVFSSSRAPSRPGEAENISFDDLVIGLQADVVYRPWMMGDRPKELDGKRVRISGYMHAGAEPVKTKEFVLLRNLECKFGPGGQADHLAQVYMKPGLTTHYPGKDPIKVEGTLKIEPFTGADGNTWSLYKIVDSEVVR